jgi:hypothetical protein
VPRIFQAPDISQRLKRTHKHGSGFGRILADFDYLLGELTNQYR